MFYWQKVVNILIYSNVWIALAALAMTWQTQLSLTGDFFLAPFPAFVFFSTLLLYSVHRLVSLRKLKDENRPKRFILIAPYRFWLKIIVVLAALLAGVLFFQLSQRLQIALLLPIALASGYALPVLPKGKRLRDVAYLKNCLIASVWVWVTVILSVAELDMPLSISIGILSVGRFCFIFALSLAFDIRDVNMDQQAEVSTIPGKIGIPATKKLAVALFVLSLGCAGTNWMLHFYTFGDWLGIGISLMWSGILVVFSAPAKSDLYFAGLLDGMMLLQFLLVWLL